MSLTIKELCSFSLYVPMSACLCVSVDVGLGALLMVWTPWVWLHIPLGWISAFHLLWYLLSNWPPEAQCAERRLTSWSCLWPQPYPPQTFQEAAVTFSAFTVPVMSHQSISLNVCNSLRTYTNPVTSFLMSLFFFYFSFSLIHSLFPSTSGFSSTCLSANQSHAFKVFPALIMDPT